MITILWSCWKKVNTYSNWSQETDSLIYDLLIQIQSWKMVRRKRWKYGARQYSSLRNWKSWWLPNLHQIIRKCLSRMSIQFCSTISFGTIDDDMLKIYNIFHSIKLSEFIINNDHFVVDLLIQLNETFYLRKTHSNTKRVLIFVFCCCCFLCFFFRFFVFFFVFLKRKLNGILSTFQQIPYNIIYWMLKTSLRIVHSILNWKIND